MSLQDKARMLRGTDLNSHHIEGFVRGGDYISIPLISHVTEGLWQGGCVDGVVLPEDFDLVVSLYPWEKYKIGAHTERIEIEAMDSPTQDPTVFEDVASIIAKRVKDGDKVLVHCQAGLNRSGLTATLALEKLGYSTEDAINLLREKRSAMVLCNPTFETWLLTRDKG